MLAEPGNFALRISRREFCQEQQTDRWKTSADGDGCVRLETGGKSRWTKRLHRRTLGNMEDTGPNFGTEASARQLSVEAAAARLGLDPFTVYSLIQRDRLSPILDDEGVFVVSEAEVEQLAKRQKEGQPC